MAPPFTSAPETGPGANDFLKPFPDRRTPRTGELRAFGLRIPGLTSAPRKPPQTRWFSGQPIPD